MAQTHTPANAGAIVPKGFEPRLFFNNGGLAQDEEQKPKPISPTNTYPQGSPSAGANDFGRQPSSPAPMASAAPSLAPKTPASDPQSRINEQMANAQRQRAEGIAAVQRGQAYDSITQQQRQQAYDTWQSTRQPGILPQPRSDMRQQEAEKAYSDTLAGRIGVATPSSPPEQLAKQLGGLDRHHAQNVQLQAAATQQSTGQQVPGLSGVYKHGEGQYSDNAQGMGFAPGFTGQPSAQNMQAANNLAGQEQKRSMMSVMREQQQAAPQQNIQMPRQENAYEREARQRERNRIMGMLQTPMTGDPRRDLTASQRQQLVAQLGQESQERQATERNMFGLAGQQLNAEAQRYKADTTAGVWQQRNLVDAARLSMDKQTQGFANRAAAQQEQLRNTVLDEQATPEQRNTAQRNLAALTGRTSTENLSNNFMRRKVPVLNDKGFPTGEQWEDIVDLRTGRVLEAPAVPPGAIAELRRNPQLAELFDDWFGPGASRAYLGGR